MSARVFELLCQGKRPKGGNTQVGEIFYNGAVSADTHRGTHFINQEDFARFLHWLDPDPERAAERYERIRRRLITICAAHRGSHPDEMADQCFDVVVSKVPMIEQTHTAAPEAYFYSVAKFVIKEWNRKPKPETLPNPELVRDSAKDVSDVEKQHACLDQCLARLDPTGRELVTEYYRHDRRVKIDHRRALALRFGITLNALRVKALRIRQTLERCVEQCVQ